MDKEHRKALEQVQEDTREVRHEHIFVGSSQRRPSLDVHEQFQTGKDSQSTVTQTVVEKVVSEDRDCEDFNVAEFPAKETEDYQRSPSPVMYYRSTVSTSAEPHVSFFYFLRSTVLLEMYEAVKYPLLYTELVFENLIRLACMSSV